MARLPGEFLPYSALFCKGHPFMAVLSSRPKISSGCLTIIIILIKYNIYIAPYSHGAPRRFTVQ